MSLDIWFADDIRNALMAADRASGSTTAALQGVARDVDYLRAYRQGYRAALATIAAAFGLMTVQVGSDLRQVDDLDLDCLLR